MCVYARGDSRQTIRPPQRPFTTLLPRLNSHPTVDVYLSSSDLKEKTALLAQNNSMKYSYTQVGSMQKQARSSLRPPPPVCSSATKNQHDLLHSTIHMYANEHASLKVCLR